METNLKEKSVYSIVLFIITIVMLVPFLIMAFTSLKTSAEINSPVFHFFPQHLQFSNYATALGTGSWGIYFFNSIFVTATVTIVSLLFNSLAGFAIARLDFRFKSFIFGSILLGLMIPPQITMVPIFIIMKHFPLAGGNDLFGMGGKGFVDSYPGLMINHMAGAFGIFLCRQYYLGFPLELDEAAEIDGCSTWRRYARIYLPLSGPVLASLAVLKTTSTWNDYIWPLVITNSDRMRTVQLALTVFKNENVQWELLMAATTAITLPLVIVFVFAQKYFVKGMLTSGLK